MNILFLLSKSILEACKEYPDAIIRVSSSLAGNVEYMASSRTQMMNKEININKSQIASKMPDMAICYIHC